MEPVSSRLGEAERSPGGQAQAGLMRIVALITHNGRGGALVAIRRLVRELGKRGHDARLLALYAYGGIEGADPEIELLDPRTGGAGLYLGLPGKLLGALRRQRPDALISFLPLANGMGALMGAVAGVPVRIASQRNPVSTYSAGMRLLDRLAGSSGLYTANVGNSDTVLASAAAYPRAYRDRLRLVHNGIETQGPDFGAKAARARMGWPEGEFVALCVGRLVREKNQEVLVRALARAPGVRLVLIGDGDRKAELEALAAELGVADRVDFLGVRPRLDVMAALEACDVFVQPSLFEGQSNALLEAMSAGAAVVSSDIGPQLDTLKGPDGRLAGVVLPPEDVDAWARTLLELKSDPARRKVMGEASLARAGAFTPEAMAEGFERVIEEARAAG
jgi:glycosyltransferase involved in cell wall biosynthesis